MIRSASWIVTTTQDMHLPLRGDLTHVHAQMCLRFVLDSMNSGFGLETFQIMVA